MSDHLYDADLSEHRLAFDAIVLPLLEGFVRFVTVHWLALTNASLALLAGLPILSPILVASDNPVLVKVGGLIFRLYSATCHQLPHRSFFILGHQVAWCQRDTAIWLTVLLFGLIFSRLRHWLKPLPWQAFVLLSLPMALDGGTQLLGFRESTWELRVITGSLFGVAVAWLVLPVVERGMAEARESLGFGKRRSEG